MKKSITLYACLLFSLFSAAQDSSGQVKITLHAFAETFYSADFDNNEIRRKPYYFNYNRNKEFNLNLGLIGVSAEHKDFRSRLLFQTGTYPMDNYRTELPVYRFIHEATVGVRFHPKLWLDAGIFTSNLGFESPYSLSNPTLTRSLTAEGSPYYLSGAKLSYQFHRNWAARLIVCNGWQRIQRQEAITVPALGTQLYHENDKGFIFNWSTYIGSKEAMDVISMRYFSDLYAILPLPRRSQLILGVDMGMQHNSFGQEQYQYWGNATAIYSLRFREHWGLGLRAEIFRDYDNMAFQSFEFAQTHMLGTSVNVDYHLNKYSLARLELRRMDPVRNGGRGLEQFQDMFVTASLAVKIDQRMN